MISPSQRYINWFKSLAVDQRSDVAFLVGGHIPGTPITAANMNSDTLADDFVAWIEKESSKGTRYNGSVTVSLIAVTELLVIRKRDSSQGWADTKAMLSELAKRDNNDAFAQGAARTEFRGRQWIASCDNWKTLRSSALSDQLIADWMEQNEFVG